jgi:hypothetical protein
VRLGDLFFFFRSAFFIDYICFETLLRSPIRLMMMINQFYSPAYAWRLKPLFALSLGNFRTASLFPQFPQLTVGILFNACLRPGSLIIDNAAHYATRLYSLISFLCYVFGRRCKVCGYTMQY